MNDKLHYGRLKMADENSEVIKSRIFDSLQVIIGIILLSLVLLILVHFANTLLTLIKSQKYKMNTKHCMSPIFLFLT